MRNRLTHGLGWRGHWLDMLGGSAGKVNEAPGLPAESPNSSGRGREYDFGGVDCQGHFKLRRKALGRKDGMLPVDSVHSDDS